MPRPHKLRQHVVRRRAEELPCHLDPAHLRHHFVRRRHPTFGVAVDARRAVFHQRQGQSQERRRAHQPHRAVIVQFRDRRLQPRFVGAVDQIEPVGQPAQVRLDTLDGRPHPGHAQPRSAKEPHEPRVPHGFHHRLAADTVGHLAGHVIVLHAMGHAERRIAQPLRRQRRRVGRHWERPRLRSLPSPCSATHDRRTTHAHARHAVHVHHVHRFAHPRHAVGQGPVAGPRRLAAGNPPGVASRLGAPRFRHFREGQWGIRVKRSPAPPPRRSATDHAGHGTGTFEKPHRPVEHKPESVASGTVSGQAPSRARKTAQTPRDPRRLSSHALLRRLVEVPVRHGRLGRHRDGV